MSRASPDAPLTVLFDGWPLVHAPSGAAAVHLQELLALVPPDAVTPVLALPGQPGRSFPVETVVIPTKPSSNARLVWEQITLPRQARRFNAGLIHLSSAGAPLFSAVPCVVSPAEPTIDGAIHPVGPSRLRAAFGRGGLTRAGALLWPVDLPDPQGFAPILRRLPPVAHPAFRIQVRGMFEQAAAESYAIVYGAFDSAAEMQRLLAAWSWAAAALGDDWSLRVSGLAGEQHAQLSRMQAEMGIIGEIQPAPADTVQEAARCLSRAGAALTLGPLHPWGDPLLRILACGRPLAAENGWGVDDRVGPAAYLAPRGDTRALGAALLTLIVEESVAEQVSRAAQDRSAAWGSERFADQLVAVYREVVEVNFSLR